MTPEHAQRLAAQDAEVQRISDRLSSALGPLTREQGFCAMRAALYLALHLGKELGGGDDARPLLAAFLLERCDADVNAAIAAVHAAKCQADAELAAMSPAELRQIFGDDIPRDAKAALDNARGPRS